MTCKQVEVKPCPFCGAPASKPYKESIKGRPVWIVDCNLFCVSMQRGSKKDVVDCWNKRVKQ